MDIAFGTPTTLRGVLEVTVSPVPSWPKAFQPHEQAVVVHAAAGGSVKVTVGVKVGTGVLVVAMVTVGVGDEARSSVAVGVGDEVSPSVAVSVGDGSVTVCVDV